jgi:hypothetical protein
MTDTGGARPGPAAVPDGTPATPPWWRSAWFTALAVAVVFPLGLALMWTRRPGWGRRTNGIVSGAVALAVTLTIAGVSRTTLGPGPTAAIATPGASGSATAASPQSTTASPSAAGPRSSPRPGSTTPYTSSPIPAGFRNPVTWPFASTSIWNMPIGRAAVYVPGNIGPATMRTVATDQDVIVIDPSGPMTPIQYNGAGWSGASRCSGGTRLATVPFPTNLVVPDGRGNYSFAILMPDGQTVVQGQPIARCTAGGPVTALHIAPSANLYTDGTLGAHGGSGLSSLGGTIRLGELVPGAPPIRHALKVNLDGAADYWPIGFRWPAIKEDGYGPQRYGGKVPALKMGALLALPASLNLASLHLQTVPGRMIAWTLQNYGAYCVDDAARSVNSIATEVGPKGAVTSQFQAAWGVPFVSGVGDTPWARDMATIFAHLDVVDNNSPATIGGPGARLQPYAPPFSKIHTASAQTAAVAPIVLVVELWLPSAQAPSLPVALWEPAATAVPARSNRLSSAARGPPSFQLLV